MAEYVKKIRTEAGDLQIDYESLANLPKLDLKSLGAAAEKHTHTPAEAGAAPESHTHSYAGSASVGGPANSVKGALTIKCNDTSLGSFNGSSPRTINITPESIGAAASSHGTHVSYGTSASALGTSSAGSASTVSRSDHVHALPALTSCTGTLTLAKGGTGVSLSSNPSILIKLDSTAAANVFAASPRPGVSGTLGIGNGGTGATKAADALKNLGVIYSVDPPTYQDGAIWLKPVE